MYLFSAILKLCSFSFCVWLYVFAPGSHCFAIDVLNRSAICTVHFRSIWTAPLRFSTCRSWAGSKVTAAKLDPKKSEFHLPNWMFTCVFFSTFFSHLFRVFLSHFQNTVFPFFPSAFSNKTHFFAFFTCFHVKTCEKCEKMRFENALGKKWKKQRFENVKKHETNVQKNKLGKKGSWKVPVS